MLPTTHLALSLIAMILDVHLICFVKDPNRFHVSHLQYSSEDTYCMVSHGPWTQAQFMREENLLKPF